MTSSCSTRYGFETYCINDLYLRKHRELQGVTGGMGTRPRKRNRHHAHGRLESSLVTASLLGELFEPCCMAIYLKIYLSVLIGDAMLCMTARIMNRGRPAPQPDRSRLHFCKTCTLVKYTGLCIGGIGRLRAPLTAWDPEAPCMLSSRALTARCRKQVHHRVRLFRQSN